MDDYDFSILDQKANNWVSTNICYDGEGQAYFKNPKGRISGKTKVTFDESGQYRIEMLVENLESEINLPLGIPQFLSGNKPNTENGLISIPYPSSKSNICKKLSVQTEYGKFIAENIKYHSLSVHIDKNEGREDKVNFYPQKSRYDVKNKKSAKFWALPLGNFLSDFMQYSEDLQYHPLRIFPDAIVPENIPEQYLDIAKFIVKQKSRLIIFNFNNQIGFIEALADYKNKEENLLNNQIPCAITSIMVGSIGNYSNDYRIIDEWFPFYLLDILSFSSGSEVFSPWIEFYDDKGNLVRRLHGYVSYGYPLFRKGKITIDEVINHGTGILISKATQCAEINETFFHVALRHTIYGGSNHQPIEDKMDHLCRALDALCEHFNVAQQKNLLELLNENDKINIKQIIRLASTKINKIAQRVKINGDYHQYQYLQTIISRLCNSATTENKFGLAVCDLLNIFKFPDAEIVNTFIKRNPRKDKIKDWASLLSNYRARVIHIGYFDIRNKKHDLWDVLHVINHLHDILTRILLSMIGYDGTYNPAVINYRIDKPINWVKSDMSAEEIGYSK